MSYCFLNHGILPSEFDKIPDEEKVLMRAALEVEREHLEKSQKKHKRSRGIGR